VDVVSSTLPLAAELAEAAAALDTDPLRWLLTGGEDHALAATFPAGTALPEGWVVIGAVRAGSGVTVDGQRYDGPAGWDHFGDR
jgi:thiamine-monophosphate kinase